MARRLLFYTHAFGGGGAEVVFARLAGAFAEGGDVVVFAADHVGPSAPVDRENLRHVVLGSSHADSTRRLAALLRSERPAASFSALGAQNLKHLTAALLAGRRGHCVLGYHGFAVAEAKRLSRAAYWLSPVATRLAAQTICVSDALLNDMRGRWHASQGRTLRIYNPLPPDYGLVASERRVPSPPLVVACGRLVPGKRFPDLVAAFAEVRPRDAQLAIIGEGPDRPSIEARVTRHGLDARVRMPGHVDDPAIWYRRASCVVIASESESFGLTAAEALAHGVPVVSTDCGGPPEILANGKYGRIVPIGNTAAMAAAITESLAAPGDPMPRIARARTFSLPVIRDAYAALADSLR